MKTYEVRRTMAATPERVWSHLTDASQLTSGGLGVLRLEGSISPGATLKLWSEASPGRAFSLVVGDFTPPRRMVWTGGLPLGLFTGTREFTLERSGNGTAFTMRERFSGPLAPLFSRMIPDLTPSFEKFANGLQALAEGSAR
jgi:hypothetical protein